jgi:hypothetical protein
MQVTARDLSFSRLQHPCPDNDCIFVGVRTKASLFPGDGAVIQLVMQQA